MCDIHARLWYWARGTTVYTFTRWSMAVLWTSGLVRAGYILNIFGGMPSSHLKHFLRFLQGMMMLYHGYALREMYFLLLRGIPQSRYILCGPPFCLCFILKFKYIYICNACIHAYIHTYSRGYTYTLNVCFPIIIFIGVALHWRH